MEGVKASEGMCGKFLRGHIVVKSCHYLPWPSAFVHASQLFIESDGGGTEN